MKKTANTVLLPVAPVPAIKLGGRERVESARYETWLRLFMRCIAVLWIAEGMMLWADVLTDESGAIVAAASPLHVSALFFFCVLDFVAAVGLWLVTTWGAAVWIATICGQILTAALAPGFLSRPVILIGADVVLFAIYAALSWLTSRENSRW